MSDVDISKATPRPWQFDELRGGHPDGCGYIRPVEGDFHEIAHHGDMGRSRDENLANAALIISAVNERDADKAEIERLRRMREDSDALLLEMNDELDCANSQRDADKALIAELVEALKYIRTDFAEDAAKFPVVVGVKLSRTQKRVNKAHRIVDQIDAVLAKVQP